MDAFDPESKPAPLTPADCDLSDFRFMPLDVARLFASSFNAHATDSEWRAGVTLWAKSFLAQLPAASLPDDDVQLARIAEVSPRRWAKLRAGALRGWIKCSDGRLYHPVVAEKALEAWLSKLTARKASDAGNSKKNGRKFDVTLHDAEIRRVCEMLLLLDYQSKIANKIKRSVLPPGEDREPTRHPTGSPPGPQQTQTQTVKEESPDGDSSKLAAAARAREREAPKPEPIWRQRLIEAHARFGDALNLTTSATHHTAVLRALCEPTTGPPCDWERDVLPAIDQLVAEFRAKRTRTLINSFALLKPIAIRNRDHRLQGLPTPEIMDAKPQTPARHRRGPASAIDAAMRAAAVCRRRADANDAAPGLDESAVDRPRLIGAG